MQNLILHIPHSSTIIPNYDGFVVPEEAIQNELNLLTDWFTDELFDLPCHKVIAPFSRLFCDVERFADDNLEAMSKVGMGMCYTHLDSGQQMRLVSADLRNRIKTEYYDKHHSKLSDLTAQLLNEHGKVLIVDCHSFSDKPFQRDLDKDLHRPDFCIGTDSYHTPQHFIDLSVDFFKIKGHSIGVDYPYQGTIVPLDYYQKDDRVQSIMLEINRKLYLKGSSNEKANNYNYIKNIAQEYIKSISS